MNVKERIRQSNIRNSFSIIFLRPKGGNEGNRWGEHLAHLLKHGVSASLLNCLDIAPNCDGVDYLSCRIFTKLLCLYIMEVMLLFITKLLFFKERTKSQLTLQDAAANC